MVFSFQIFIIQNSFGFKFASKLVNYVNFVVSAYDRHTHKTQKRKKKTEYRKRFKKRELSKMRMGFEVKNKL